MFLDTIFEILKIKFFLSCFLFKYCSTSNLYFHFHFHFLIYYSSCHSSYFLQEDSGAQITIDKPPTNIVPANRVITIKGAPVNADKARQLVTKALNTPSLATHEIINNPQHPNAAPRQPPQLEVANLECVTQESSPVASKKRVKPLPSSEVRPLISYSKVAKASTTIDELAKEIETTCKVLIHFNFSLNSFLGSCYPAGRASLLDCYRSRNFRLTFGHFDG